METFCIKCFSLVNQQLKTITEYNAFFGSFSCLLSQNNVSVEDNFKQEDIECCAQLFVNQKTAIQRQTVN